MLANITPVTNLVESGPLTWDMAKQIIQSQHNLAIYGITAVVGLAILVVAASWLWNLYLHKRELQRAIESLKSEISTKVEENFAKLAERNKNEVREMKEEIKKTVAERMTLFDAEMARNYALTNAQRHQWENVVDWWSIAIRDYAKAGHEEGLRLAVDGLYLALGQCKKLRAKSRKAVKERLSFIPEILTKEKEQIEDKLSKLPEEIPEESGT